MAQSERPQLYLISPPDLEPVRFGDMLAAILDATDVACFRLALASGDEDHVARSADAMRP